MADKLIRKFEVPIIRRLINFIIYSIFRCRKSNFDERYLEGSRVIVERAAEPSDVYWENLSVTTMGRVKKSFITNGVALLCLCVAFGVNLGLSIAKAKLDKSKGQSNNSAAATIIGLISALTSFFVVFINYILGRIIRILSAYEQHETYSKFHISVASKLTIATFINTGFVPLLVNVGKDNWFNNGGLCEDIFFNMLSISFFGPFFYLLNPLYCVKRIKQ